MTDAGCIYVSYAHADEAWAISLRDRLHIEGYSLCERRQLAENAATLVVVTTPASAASEGVISELQTFPGHRRAVIPVVPPTVTNPTLDWMPHYLALLDVVDCAGDEEAAIQKLLAMLGPPDQYGPTKADERRTLLRRIPIGLPVVGLLLAALVAAFALPEGSPIPRPVGYLMLILGVFGVGFLVWSVVQQAQHESAKKKRLRIPDAFVEVIDSGRKREAGKRFAIKSAQTTIGKGSGNQIRLARRGVGAQQCRIVWDQYDEAFYLETSDAQALTVLHDTLLEPERPMPIDNGDIIMLADQVVIQFRLGNVR